MSNKDLDYLANILDSIEKIRICSAQFENADKLLEDSKSFDAV